MNFFKKNTTFVVIAIVAVAGILRFSAIGTNPPSLTWDEVAWGYNAYSLGIDGRDEFGRFLPVDYLESFGDYKPPLYAYLDILPIKIWGLNEFATRFPSAFFGTLTVLLTYFLTKSIFFNSKYKEKYGLLASAILAVSPWHFMLSRAAFEANIATFFVALGMWLFFVSMQSKKWLLILSSSSFALSFYIFNTPRVVVPLLVACLVVGQWKLLWENKKQTMVALFVGLIILIPTIPFLLTPQASLRFKEVNIFSESKPVIIANQEVANDNNAIWSKGLHNFRVRYGLEFLRHYLDHLNPTYLFISGDQNVKFSTQDTGQMYILDSIFLLVGAYVLFRKKEGYYWMLPLWIVVGIIPAGLARETPHALRTEITLPVWHIIVSVGLFHVSKYLLSLRFGKVAISGVIIFYILSVGYFLRGYFLFYPSEQADFWQMGYKDAVLYMKEHSNEYEKLFLTESFGRAYAYTLFYLKYDPREFRRNAQITREVFGFVHVNSFDKYYFGMDPKTNIDLSKTKNVLYITENDEVPKRAKVKKHFYLPNGKIALTAYILTE